MGFLRIWLIIRRLFSDSEGGAANVFAAGSYVYDISGCEFRGSTNLGSRSGAPGI